MNSDKNFSKMKLKGLFFDEEGVERSVFIELESLYQAFEARLMDEICALLPKDELFDLQIPLKDKKRND